MRDTQTLTTPGGHTVIINTYLTGREQSAINGAVTAAMKMTPPSQPGEATQMGEISGAFYADIEQKTMAFMVVSVDGVIDKALDLLLDLPASEYDFVKSEVDKLTNPTTPGTSA